MDSLNILNDNLGIIFYNRNPTTHSMDYKYSNLYEIEISKY